MALTITQRKKIEASVGQAIEKAIPAEAARQLSGLDPAALTSLAGALTTGVRAKLAAELGVGAAVTVGGGSPVSGSVSLNKAVTAGADKQTFGAPAVSSLQAGLTATLTASLDEALLGLGLSPAERAEAKRQLQPRLTDALSRGVRSAVALPTAYPSGAGAPVLEAEVTMQRVGTWHAEVTLDLDEDEALDGQLVFQVDGIEFRGTVMPSRGGAYAGQTKVKVVGGAGGLYRELEPRNYAGGVTRVRTVVTDILRDAGEALSPEADATVLDAQIPGWQRSKGRAIEALQHICDRQNATWRVLRDGTVWIGVDNWPEVEPGGVIEDEDWAKGTVTVSPNEPGLVPGVVCRGQRVEQVVHRIGPRGSFQELQASSVRSAMDAFLKKIRSVTEYAYRYRCRVARQNGDGSVDVEVEDARMKGRGVGSCRIRAGVPGARIVVPAGARCLVGWDDGDPARPYVSDWDSETPFTSIDIG